MAQAVLVQIERFNSGVVFSRIRKTLGKWRQWRQRIRERNQLARFNDYALKDIGLTRLDAHREINKSFWQV